MNTQQVYPFLRALAEHNTRQWFAENKERYLAAREEYTRLVARAIAIISQFDPAVLPLIAADCLFRLPRDIRFSADKSPYKRHFGAYICEGGRRSLRGGYYLHVQPNNTFLAAGAYCLPTPILRACRNEIMARSEAWRASVEQEAFIHYFGTAATTALTPTSYAEQMPPHGFGSTHLARCPQGFPADSPLVPYLRMKDYSCWHSVGDDFFEGDAWEEQTADIFRTAKPMVDFINAVIADYE